MYNLTEQEQKEVQKLSEQIAKRITEIQTLEVLQELERVVDKLKDTK